MTFNTATARFNRMGWCAPSAMAAFSTAVDLSTYDVESVSIKYNIQNAYPTLDMVIDGYQAFTYTAYTYGYYKTTDHLGVSQTLFAGIIPRDGVTFDRKANKTKITGYGLGYYLSESKVTSDCYHNTAGQNPAMTIFYIFGGDDWAAQTGIEPYKLVPDSAWGSTLSSRVFDFDRNTSRLQAAKKIMDYNRYYLHLGIRDVSSIPQPCAYFVPEASLDTYCDLPAQLTVANPSSYLDAPLNVETKAERKYNRVTVRGRLAAGGTVTKTLCTDGVLNGTEIPIEYVESSGAWTTQTQVDARCSDLYTYLSSDAITVSGRFVKRMDLRLLQKLVFSGYTGVPTDALRITEIAYNISKQGKYVSFQATPDAIFRNTRLMYRVMNPDPVSETEAIFDSKAAQIPTNELGTVTAVSGDGYTGTVLLEDGREIEGRI